MSPFQKRVPVSIRAFTLIELLVVLLIVGVLATMSVAGFMQITKSTGLNSGAQSVSNQFTLARQLSISRNRPVEIQFVKVTDEQGLGEAYRAIRLGVVESAKTNFLGKIIYLPKQVVISEDSQLSSILSSTDIRENSAEIGALGSVKYRSFRFLPDGTTDLPMNRSQTWHLTVLSEVEAQKVGIFPKNFYTFSVDPMTGVVRTYRP